MSSAVATPNSSALSVDANISYTMFKQALITLHEQGKDGAEEGDFTVISRGIRLLNEMAEMFPGYARQLADDPDFLR